MFLVCGFAGAKVEVFSEKANVSRLSPQGVLYLLVAKGTQNHPHVAFAGSEFGDAKTGAFAGLQANRPRFYTLCLHSALFPLQAIMRRLKTTLRTMMQLRVSGLALRRVCVGTRTMDRVRINKKRMHSCEHNPSLLRVQNRCRSRDCSPTTLCIPLVVAFRF